MCRYWGVVGVGGVGALCAGCVCDAGMLGGVRVHAGVGPVHGVSSCGKLAAITVIGVFGGDGVGGIAGSAHSVSFGVCGGSGVTGVGVAVSDSLVHSSFVFVTKLFQSSCSGRFLPWSELITEYRQQGVPALWGTHVTYTPGLIKGCRQVFVHKMQETHERLTSTFHTLWGGGV